MKLCHNKIISIDQPFYPFVKSVFPTVGDGVDTVTIRNLLEMKGGMVVNGTLYGSDLWYSNTHYSILQALPNVLTGPAGQWPDHYAQRVNDNVLKPTGIDGKIFTRAPILDLAQPLPTGTQATNDTATSGPK